MLRALYDYSVRNNLVLPAGFVYRQVKAYISLTRNGEYAGLELSERSESVLCPDIGTLANGKDKSNVLAEKRLIVLPTEENSKSNFFIKTLKSASEAEPMLSACVLALENTETVAKIIADADRNKIKESDRISFKVDGMPILTLPEVKKWWAEYRLQFQKDSGEKTRCLITGELVTPAVTVSPIQGLKAVGGHASGDSLICFDKNAFCSYGQKQAANAPVSEEAMLAVKAGLDELLKDAPILAGMKFVHWYDKPLDEEHDNINGVIQGESEDEDEEEAADETYYDAADAKVQRSKADNLVNAPVKGEQPTELPNVYYILLLSGVGGRVMIRRYDHGNYKDLQKNLKQWWSDIRLTDLKGTGRLKINKLTAMLIRLLKKQKSDKDVFKRLDKELSGITPTVLTAILGGGSLPDAVAAKALAYIRSQMLDTDDESKSAPIPDGMCCQWLKAWLLRTARKNNREEYDMVNYNGKHPAAYHCGSLVALFAEIQQKAMGNYDPKTKKYNSEVNSGIVQRYYAAASQSPALVLGQLSKLANYHLSKMDKGIAVSYQKKLAEVYDLLGDNIPKVMPLEGQAYFALGYYQMIAELNRQRAENKASQNQSNENNEEG